MWRQLGFIAAASMFLFQGLAEAQEPDVLTLKAIFKADRSTGKELSFIYISGDTLYPDGTKLFVGVQPPDGFKYLMTVSCYVDKGHFLAEIGPWEQHFPPGKYRVVAEFRFEDQTPAMQSKFGDFRDTKQCIIDDPKFAAEYELQNPARYKLFKDYVARTGRCPGKTGSGDTHLVIGSEEDADRARVTEKETLRGYAGAAGHLAATLAALPEADFASALATWRAEWSDFDTTIRRQRSAVVCCSYAEAAASVESAFINLDWLAGDVEALFVRGTRLRKDVESLSSKGASIDKDERRRLASLKTQLSALEAARASHARTVAEAIADALYGPKGLEPAPARARKHVQELLEPFGVEPQTK
ncbi:MAG: hypothetical protein AAB074_15190 [Planctomycetota bacterium]